MREACWFFAGVVFRGVGRRRGCRADADCRHRGRRAGRPAAGRREYGTAGGGGDEAVPAAGTPYAIWRAGLRGSRPRRCAISFSGASFRRVDHPVRHGAQPARPRRREAPGVDDTIDPVPIAPSERRSSPSSCAPHQRKSLARMLLRSVARMIAAVVTPSGRPASPAPSLLRARAVVERASPSLRLTGRCLCRQTSVPQRTSACGGRRSGGRSATSPVEDRRPPFSSAGPSPRSQIQIVAKPALVSERNRSVVVIASPDGSEPLAPTSSSDQSRIGLSTFFPAALP